MLYSTFLLLCFHSLIALGNVPGGTSGKEPTCQCRRCKRCWFHLWVGKIPWRRAWQPLQYSFPRESHGQRSLAGYTVHRDVKSQTWLKHISTHGSTQCKIISCLWRYVLFRGKGHNLSNLLSRGSGGKNYVLYIKGGRVAECWQCDISVIFFMVILYFICVCKFYFFSPQFYWAVIDI